MIVWKEEFPSSYQVPVEILELVFDGFLEDMSWRQDPCPSFGRKLKDKNWVRLWVEHPDPVQRIGWPDRYTIIVQPEPSIPFGWKMVSTESVHPAMSGLMALINKRKSGLKFYIKGA